MLKPSINLKAGVPMLIVAFAISLGALYGGAQLVKQEKVSAEDGGGAAAGGGAVGPGPVSVTIVAKNITFDLSTLTANAGQDFTVTLDNEDAGVLHNIAFYTDQSLSQPIYVSELTTGPEQQENTFTAPSAPGTYYFHCDVHPDTMNGAFVVQ
jgi:plastocyanin